MQKKKPNEQVSKKFLAFFVEHTGVFDSQMRYFASQMILDLTKKLDEPSKGEVAELLGVQRSRLARLLVGLGIEQNFREIVIEKRERRKRARKETRA